MNREHIEKYALFAGILVLGVALDQWTKWYASQRLANGRISNGHAITLRVSAASDGDTVRKFLGRELSANSEGEIDQIASRWVYGPDGVRLAAGETVREGQLLTVVHRTVTVVDGFFDLEYAENRGAAFSFLADTDSPYRLPFLIGFSALALLVVLYLLWTIRRDNRAMMLALSLVATGAVGNLIDRVRLGYVIDFILWKYGTAFRWPTFNLADSFITVGVVLMLVEVFFGAEPPGEVQSPDDS